MKTRRDHVEAAFQRRKSGRLACFPLVDVAYASAHQGAAMSRAQLDPEWHAGALTQCVQDLPTDGVYVNLCLSPEQAQRAVCHADRYSVTIDDCLEVQIPINDVASIAQTDVRNLDDPRIETAELFHPGMLATFRQMPREAKDQAAIFAGLTGTFSQLAFLIGLENLLVAMVDDPEGVQRALRRRHKVARRQAVALCEAGARFVWIGEGMASGSLISPRMFQEFVLPYEQELADVLRDHGAWSVLHICGNATPMLPWMGASRVDGCDLDYLTDWPAAVRTLGTRLVLKGNINPMLLLPENQQNLAEACQQTKRLAGDAPGFILSTGCLVPRDADPSAFEIMAKTCAL